MKKVLLINEGLSDNLGDQAINYTIQKLIQKKGMQVEFEDFTRNKKINYNYDKYIQRKNDNKIKKNYILLV